jgi:hypothetical protein
MLSREYDRRQRKINRQAYEKKPRLPKGFQVSVSDQGLRKFAVSVSHLGQRAAFFSRNFASPLHAREVGVSSAIALADCLQRGIKL